MKKLLLATMALLCSLTGKADNNGFAIDNDNHFTIAANGEATIQIKMNNDVVFSGVQFDLELPEGVSIKYDDDEEEYCVSRTSTSRLTNSHIINTSEQSNGTFRIMVYSSSSKPFKGNSGDALLEIELVASDQVATGDFTPKFRNIVMSQADETQYKPADCTYNCTVTLSTTVTTLGYASFSWPKALDFTNSGLTAYIATSCNNSSLHLEPVTKVPANTGLILKGTAGSENTYPLETTNDESLDDVSENMLTSNTTGVYEVTTNNVYVLSNLDDGRPGFYLAGQGIQVGQYKSYLVLSTNLSRRGLVFDEGTTGINGVGIQEQPVDNHIYNLNGQRLQTSAVGSVPQKGIYIMSGKKRIVR